MSVRRYVDVWCDGPEANTLGGKESMKKLKASGAEIFGLIFALVGILTMVSAPFQSDARPFWWGLLFAALGWGIYREENGEAWFQKAARRRDTRTRETRDAK